MAGNSSGLSLGSPKPLLGFLGLSLSFPGLCLGSPRLSLALRDCLWLSWAVSGHSCTVL